MSLELAHTGLHTVAHHQCYQMVDLLMQHCRKTMGGLNPSALPCVPSTQPIVAEESTNAKRNNKENAESSKWHACKTNKGWRDKNNNKKFAVDRNVNPYEILSVEEEEDNVEETHMQKRNQEIKSKKEPPTTKNSCDIDDITVEEIETFIEKITDGETNGGGDIVECEKCSMCKDDVGAVIGKYAGLKSAHDSLAYEMDGKDTISQYCELNAYSH